MLFRPIDSQGDMLPVTRRSQILGKVEALGEIIKSRMSLHRGEWWEDPDVGSPVLGILTAGKISEEQIGALSHQIIEYLSGTAGIRTIQASQPQYNRQQRAMILPCSVNAISGDTVTMEVSTSI